MSTSTTPSGFDPRFAQRCWGEIHQAMLSEDDRALWLAWKKHFPLRFWRGLDVPGVGALCRDAGIEYGELLRRVTGYDRDAKRDKLADEVQVERESQRPPRS